MNAPTLADPLRRGLPNVRRFVAAAVASERPVTAELVAAGVPHYDARDLLERLDRAGEIGAEGWRPEVREAYRSLLADPPPRARLQRLHEAERPREKAARLGVASLADAELMALILRTGTGEEGVLEVAARLLEDHDGLLGLADHDVAELAEARGLGQAKAAELAAAFELGRRLAQARRRDRPLLNTPEAVIEVLRTDLAPLRHEEFRCLPLDARSRLIGEPRLVSRGDVDGTEAGPRAFFRTALRAGAVSAIAVHNHPTGDASPSAADLAVTRRLVRAGTSVDVELADHLIVGDGGRFTSLRRLHPEYFRG